MRSTAVNTNQTRATYSDELTGAHPNYPRPWEDTTLPAQERYESYRQLVRAKCSAIVEASRREGITPAERRELKKHPDSEFWAGELTRINSETPHDFCWRIDSSKLMARLLSRNFLGAAAWKKAFNVDVGSVPSIPYWITKKLLEEACQLHPGYQVKDTHLLVLMPKTVDAKAYCAIELGMLCEARKRLGDKRLLVDSTDSDNKWKSEPWAKESQVDSEWILIPKWDPRKESMEKHFPRDGNIRHFRGKSIADQENVLKLYYRQDYREARAVEVMTANLLNAVINGQHPTQAAFLRTRELTDSGDRVEVGGVYSDLRVLLDPGRLNLDSTGLALVRKQAN